MPKFLRYLQNVRSELKTLEKNRILKKAIWRKDFFLKHPLYINHEETKIRIKWLKSLKEIEDYLAPLKELDYHQGFMLTSKISFNTKNFCINYDVLICDLNWRVLKRYSSLKPNSYLGVFDKTAIVLVLCESTITYYNIEDGDLVCPLANVN